MRSSRFSRIRGQRAAPPSAVRRPGASVSGVGSVASGTRGSVREVDGHGSIDSSHVARLRWGAPRLGYHENDVQRGTRGTRSEDLPQRVPAVSALIVVLVQGSGKCVRGMPSARPISRSLGLDDLTLRGPIAQQLFLRGRSAIRAARRRIA